MRRLRTVTIVTLLSLALPAAAQAAPLGGTTDVVASPADRARHAAEQARERDPDLRQTVGSYRDEAGSTTFLGGDGKTYPAAPTALTAADGTVFWGGDFDSACAFQGRTRRKMRNFSKLVRMIERSGRTVRFTVAPNKSSVDTAALRTVSLPHGNCDAKGMSDSTDLIQSWPDRAYLPTLRLQRQSLKGGQSGYWQLDTHWNTLGSALFARELARSLDPRLANRQRYQSVTDTIPVDLYLYGAVTQQYESGAGVLPATRVRVRPTRGNPVWDPAGIDFDVTWQTTPKSRTWPGRTLLLGDSFSYRALGNLRPLFSRGRFRWVDPRRSEQLAREVARSDTVVLEVVERFMPVTLLTSRRFRQDVRRALLDR